MGQNSFNDDLYGFFKSIRFTIFIILSLWIVKGVEVYFGYSFVRYGIYPREADGIVGIFSSPFIHGDWGHLVSNTFPLLFVMIMMQFFYQRIYVLTTIVVWMLTGVLVWLFARPSYHIGASGVVYGLIGFLLWSGLFRKDNRAITLSLLVLAIYSSYFLGFEKKEGVSWESHMLGALVGLVIAFAFRNVREPEEISTVFPPSDSLKTRYFAPDTFEKTKYQKWLDSQVSDNG